MDFGGHCHEALEDGGYLFLDQFGHCHVRLDDGGFLYMDRQGSAHKALDDDNAPQGPPAQRSPRPGHAATASAMLGAGETPAASKAAMAAHDGEMRAMKRKGKKGAMFGGESKKRDHNPNTYTRKRHFIGQPRKFN
mmetsp:Transcript_37015/g.66243  ORF Transcript_37015/g.66243 Transcript_37015/m.66243 type:complete len:136 (-) Transcript_37015:171-578(-)|eukprot:CAMPEP_0177760352 /NCGR_PEP_ID=MMETSP0491_2-20121128/5222_1 /TAXON_ID=63592 /ORGANISM="Tetraselmis chuii, Strain PLY429" /LENGTH=135 /DNA_ID=CAMNT_0019276247 /DNA_START=983 /DNA_END=1390 /DNA_ORIENTATION=+